MIQPSTSLMINGLVHQLQCQGLCALSTPLIPQIAPTIKPEQEYFNKKKPNFFENRIWTIQKEQRMI